MGIVYAINNDKNDKKYIGVISKNTKQAMALLDHRTKLLNTKDVNSCQMRDLTNAMIRKEVEYYNGDIIWNYSIIEENVPNERLNDRRFYWIKKYNTDDFRFGYNVKLNTYQRFNKNNKNDKNTHSKNANIQTISKLDSSGSINFNGSFEGLLEYINTLKEIINDKEINIDIKWN